MAPKNRLGRCMLTIGSEPGGLVHVRLRRRLPVLVNSNLLVSNDRRESRMRENRRTGSEGGEPQINAAFLPLSL